MSAVNTNPVPKELPTDIEAQNEWLKTVNSKLVVMIKNAGDVLHEYVLSLDQILVALRETQTIYSRLHSDLIEALDEHRTTSNTRLHQPQSGHVPERGGESDSCSSSSDPDPFGLGDDSA